MQNTIHHLENGDEMKKTLLLFIALWVLLAACQPTTPVLDETPTLLVAATPIPAPLLTLPDPQTVEPGSLREAAPEALAVVARDWPTAQINSDASALTPVAMTEFVAGKDSLYEIVFLAGEHGEVVKAAVRNDKGGFVVLDFVEAQAQTQGRVLTVQGFVTWEERDGQAVAKPYLKAVFESGQMLGLYGINHRTGQDVEVAPLWSGEEKHAKAGNALFAMVLTENAALRLTLGQEAAKESGLSNWRYGWSEDSETGEAGMVILDQQGEKRFVWKDGVWVEKVAFLPSMTPEEWQKMPFSLRDEWLKENGVVIGVTEQENVSFEYVFGMVRAQKTDGSIRWFSVTEGKWMDEGEWEKRLREMVGVAVTGEQLGDMKPEQVPQKFVYGGETYVYDYRAQVWRGESGQALAELTPVSFFGEKDVKAALWTSGAIKSSSGQTIEFLYSPHTLGLFDFGEINAGEAQQLIDLIKKHDGKASQLVQKAIDGGAPIRIFVPDMGEVPSNVQSVFTHPDGEQELMSAKTEWYRGEFYGRSVSAYRNEKGEVILLSFTPKEVLHRRPELAISDEDWISVDFAYTANYSLRENGAGLVDDFTSQLCKSGVVYVIRD